MLCALKVCGAKKVVGALCMPAAYMICCIMCRSGMKVAAAPAVAAAAAVTSAGEADEDDEAAAPAAAAAATADAEGSEELIATRARRKGADRSEEAGDTRRCGCVSCCVGCSACCC